MPQAALADIPRQAEAAEQRALWEADITNYVIVSGSAAWCPHSMKSCCSCDDAAGRYTCD
jgi:hypothetical protein